jgi:hypothetical protein
MKNEPHAAAVKGLLNRTLLELSLSDTDERATEIENGAQEAAIKLLEMAGFDAQDSDHFGDEMGDVVQTLLTIAMMRCPQLAERIMDASYQAFDN